MLKLYNSLGRKVERFEPIRRGQVRMYACGPTVWNYAHVGNFRTFVFEDTLRRYLRFKGYEVFEVKNITDVEDRIIRGIKETKKPRAELTAFYEKAFMTDLDTLKIERAEKYPRATENIDEMVRVIRVLMEKGHAYRAPDGSVYFDVSSYPGYGALSGVKLGTGRESGRVSQDHYEDRQEAADFALWKAWDPDDGDVFWETELGKGRPGWHIECSAMSMKYLGESFDIHTGGLDLKFPHHENELAQSRAATGERFVNYWLHSGFLTVRGEEMHKSVGNVVYLSELMGAGWDPQEIRLFLITPRYRDPIDLTDAGLEQARAQRTRLMDFVARLKAAGGKRSSRSPLAKRLLDEFEEAMDDDLNTPRALSAIFSFVKRVNTLIDSEAFGKEDASKALDALERINSVLGVLDFVEQALPSELAELIALRDAARKRKDFAESDRLRDRLLSAGIEVEDTPAGTRWKKTKRG